MREAYLNMMMGRAPKPGVVACLDPTCFKEQLGSFFTWFNSCTTWTVWTFQTPSCPRRALTIHEQLVTSILLWPQQTEAGFSKTTPLSYTILPNVFTHPSNNWNQVFQSLPWPQVYKSKHLGMPTVSTNICERVDHSQQLSEFQHGTVIGCHLYNKSSREISSLLNIP